MSEPINATSDPLVDLHLRVPKRIMSKLESMAQELDTSVELVAAMLSYGAFDLYTDGQRTRRDHLIALLKGTIEDLQKETPKDS